MLGPRWWQAFLAECTARCVSQDELGCAATSDKSSKFQGLNCHLEHTTFKFAMTEANFPGREKGSRFENHLEATGWIWQ